jgi:hypothetical protein
MEVDAEAAPVDSVEFVLDQHLFRHGGVYLPREDVGGNPIVLTKTNTRELTPLSNLPILDQGDGGGAHAMTDIRVALSVIPGLGAASLYAALQNLNGLHINMYEDEIGGHKVFKIYHSLNDPTPESD